MASNKWNRIKARENNATRAWVEMHNTIRRLRQFCDSGTINAEMAVFGGATDRACYRQVVTLPGDETAPPKPKR